MKARHWQDRSSKGKEDHLRVLDTLKRVLATAQRSNGSQGEKGEDYCSVLAKSGLGVRTTQCLPTYVHGNVTGDNWSGDKKVRGRH